MWSNKAIPNVNGLWMPNRYSSVFIFNKFQRLIWFFRSFLCHFAKVSCGVQKVCVWVGEKGALIFMFAIQKYHSIRFLVEIHSNWIVPMRLLIDEVPTAQLALMLNRNVINLYSISFLHLNDETKGMIQVCRRIKYRILFKMLRQTDSPIVYDVCIYASRLDKIAIAGNNGRS